MKIKFGTEQKRIVTVDQLPAVKELISSLKEEDFKWDAECALSFAAGTDGEILKIDAEIAKNSAVWNLYNDASENIDVWVTVYALTYKGFYSIGTYLSDIWKMGPDDVENEIRGRMYVRKFTEEN